MKKNRIILGTLLSSPAIFAPVVLVSCENETFETKTYKEFSEDFNKTKEIFAATTKKYDEFKQLWNSKLLNKLDALVKEYSNSLDITDEHLDYYFFKRKCNEELYILEDKEKNNTITSMEKARKNAIENVLNNLKKYTFCLSFVKEIYNKTFIKIESYPLLSLINEEDEGKIVHWLQISFSYPVEILDIKTVIDTLDKMKTNWSGKNIYIEFAKNYYKQTKNMLLDDEPIEELKKQADHFERAENDIKAVIEDLKTFTKQIEDQYKKDLLNAK